MKTTNQTETSGLNSISGNASLLRNADVGHMLELRERLAEAELEKDRYRSALEKILDIDEKCDYEANSTYIAMCQIFAVAHNALNGHE